MNSSHKTVTFRNHIIFALISVTVFGSGCANSLKREAGSNATDTHIAVAASQRPDALGIETVPAFPVRLPLEWVQNLTYTADGPSPINLRDIPARTYDRFNKYDQGRRKASRIPAPIPKEEMDRLRAEAKRAPYNLNIQLIDRARQGVLGPTLGVGFDALDANDCCGGGLSVPPDPEMAVGPNHIIVVVNVAMAIYDKSGTLLSGPTTLASFFTGTAQCNTSVFDPNVLYDESTDRFIVGVDGGGNSYCVAATTGPDPTGSWNRYGFWSDFAGAFFDYPHAGVGRDAIYMGSNQFGGSLPGGFEGRVFAMDKAAMYSGTTMTVVTQSTSSSNSTPQPMNVHGFKQGTWPTSGPHYLMTEVFDGAVHSVWSWNDPFGANVLTKAGDLDLNTATGVTATMPIDWPQQSSSDLLQGNDWRGLDTEYRNGKIWMTGTISCNPGGGAVNCIRWAQIDPTGPSILQSGVFSSVGEYRVFPDLAVNHCDDMAVGYTKGSSSMYPSVYVTGRQGTDVLGTLQTEVSLKTGERAYDSFQRPGPHRWGDYSGMTVDPDGQTFWYLGEYSKNITNYNPTTWGNYVGSFAFSCQAPLDSDGDGIPDITDTDDDNDGAPDTSEVANGTDPLDANDWPQPFADVTNTHAAYTSILVLSDAGIVVGCGGGAFCPEMIATRDLAAIWLIKAVEGNAYTPPGAIGSVFGDVGNGDFNADWIEDLSGHQITSGCGGGDFCPKQAVTKDQAAQMLLKARYGIGYAPGAATGGVYGDVGAVDFAADWIEDLANKGYAEGCGGGNYCPEDGLTLAGFAKLLAKTFGLMP